MKTHKYLDEIKEICKWKHLTVDEILLQLKKKYPKAWIATVYRAVDFLVKKWEMRKIENIDKTSYYETLIEPHIHFIDEQTWKIFDISLEKISVDESLFDKISDIRIIWRLKNVLS